nr:hypothetical protein GCM10017547_31720 [Pseudarthrobacter oxydans]
MWSVQPNLFDGWIVQEGLENAEPGDGVEEEFAGRIQGPKRRKRTHQSPLVIIRYCCLHQAADLTGLMEGIKPSATDELADFILDYSQRVHKFPNTTAAPAEAVQLG